jgi:hypothetical protein
VIPRLAVVGHPNKGKSSIVATLSEDGDVAISDLPGTTVSRRSFPMTVDGEVLYELIDTPGFQRPRQMLAWLEAHNTSADDRAQAVGRFVAEHAYDPKFHDECELLAPLLEGAGILYVVDGSVPYGKEYESEMEVLRWTGRPRMALINMIGDGDYGDEWRRALDQYFAIVRTFDAVRADAQKRFALLTSFGELSEAWQPALDRAVSVLREDRERRERTSGQEIAALLVEALTLTLTDQVAEDEDAGPAIDRLEARLRAQLTRREQQARRQVEAFYRYTRLELHEAQSAPLDLDLFAQESRELFGLTTRQLVATGTVGGAMAGGGIDLAIGGASLLLGAGIGAVLGGASALFGQDQLAKVKLLGQSLVSRNLTIGPVKDPGLVWVLLGRALLHHRLVSERNHARREALVIEVEQERHLSQTIPEDMHRALAQAFASIRKGSAPQGHAAVAMLIKRLLALTENDGGLAGR